MARRAVGDTGSCEQEKPLGLCLMIRRGVASCIFSSKQKSIFFFLFFFFFIFFLPAQARLRAFVGDGIRDTSKNKPPGHLQKKE